MADKHHKRCTTPLAIRETQIQATMRNHFKFIRMSIIKTKEQRNYNIGRMWKTGILVTCCGDVE
jgi:hypothetical protein